MLVDEHDVCAYSRGVTTNWAVCPLGRAWPPFTGKAFSVNGSSFQSSRVQSLNLTSISVLTAVLSMFPAGTAFAESVPQAVPGGYAKVLPVGIQNEGPMLRPVLWDEKAGFNGAPSASPKLTSASEGQSSNDVAKLVGRGVDQMNRNDVAGASNTFKQVLKSDPGNKYAWYNLGVIAQQSNKPTSARTAYEKALKTDPRFGPALFNEAVLLQASNPDRALTLLKRAVASNPKASTAYFLMGEIMAKRGSKKDAKEAFTRAVAIDPQLRSQVPAGFLG